MKGFKTIGILGAIASLIASPAWSGELFFRDLRYVQGQIYDSNKIIGRLVNNSESEFSGTNLGVRIIEKHIDGTYRTIGYINLYLNFPGDTFDPGEEATVQSEEMWGVPKGNFIQLDYDQTFHEIKK